MLRARSPLLLTSFATRVAGWGGVYFCRRAVYVRYSLLRACTCARARERGRRPRCSRADNIEMPAALAAPAGEGLFVLTCHVRDVLRVADVP